MKRLLVIAVLGGFALSATAQDTTPEILVRGYQIQLPEKPMKMFKGDFDDYQGAYELSNGETLIMKKTGLRMYATVGDGEPKEIVAASRGVFVAKDRELKVSLVRESAENITGELLMVRRSASMQANAAPQVIRLAAR